MVDIRFSRSPFLSLVSFLSHTVGTQNQLSVSRRIIIWQCIHQVFNAHSKSLSGRKYNHGLGLYQGVIIKRLDPNSFFLEEFLAIYWNILSKWIIVIALF
jgi:hypothetical protein